MPTSPTPATPLYWVTGRVTDGASGFGSGNGLSLPVKVEAIDAAHFGKSVTADVSGSYVMKDVVGGSLTLSASAYGYQTTTKTVIVTRNTEVDFALPRSAKSPVPDLAGVWGARMEWGSFAWLAEFTLTQTGSSLSGTWWVPKAEWRGTITGTTASDRSVTGRMTVNTPDGCAGAGDLSWGLLDYSERFLNLSVTFVGSCGPSGAGRSDLYSFIYSFFLDRTCRVTSIPGLACDPIVLPYALAGVP